MLIFKLVTYLVGHVSILINGEVEKFFNLAIYRNIYLWDIRWVSEDLILAKVKLTDVGALRHIARKTKSRFRIIRRKGLPFLIAYLRRHKMFALGAIMFVGALYLLSSFAWFIEVSGNRQVPDQVILKAAEKAGLKQGVPLWRLDIFSVENKIREQLPSLAWIGIYVQGTKVNIEVAERKLIEKEEKGPAHLVAVKDGLITDVLVIDGYPLVKEGDTVTAGQVLISGEIPPNLKTAEKAGIIPPARKYVRARGIVRARVWYEEYGEAKLIEKGYYLTGRTITALGMKINSREIILVGAKEIPFKHYKTKRYIKKIPEWRNITLPVELHTLKYSELKAYRKERSYMSARRLAEMIAREKVQRELTKGARVLKQQVLEIKGTQSKNIVKVKLSLETVEDIGREVKVEVGKGN